MKRLDGVVLLDGPKNRHVISFMTEEHIAALIFKYLNTLKWNKVFHSFIHCMHCMYFMHCMHCMHCIHCIHCIHSIHFISFIHSFISFIHSFIYLKLIANNDFSQINITYSTSASGIKLFYLKAPPKYTKLGRVCIRAKWSIRPELIPVSAAWSD